VPDTHAHARQTHAAVLHLAPGSFVLVRPHAPHHVRRLNLHGTPRMTPRDAKIIFPNIVGAVLFADMLVGRVRRCTRAQQGPRHRRRALPRGRTCIASPNLRSFADLARFRSNPLSRTTRRRGCDRNPRPHSVLSHGCHAVALARPYVDAALPGGDVIPCLPPTVSAPPLHLPRARNDVDIPRAHGYVHRAAIASRDVLALTTVLLLRVHAVRRRSPAPVHHHAGSLR
jgi:hypothetical protein